MLPVILIWMLIALVVGTYLLFPALVLLRARLWPRPCHSGTGPASWPEVSILIAAHNEADCIARKLDNMLELDYPREKLEVIIASDGSDDGTDDIVRARTSARVRLISLPRGGKARALNAAAAVARGEVLVFSDANSMFDRDALRALVAPLADPEIGGVAGDQRYDRGPANDASGAGERGYWNFDRWLKRAESRGGHVISATGAIYCIRRRLFQAVPEGVTDDFVTSTRVIAQGYRLVFCEQAVAREPVASRVALEFGRKVRVISRGLRGVWLMRGLLNARRFGFYSLELAAHKVLRRLMVFPLLGILALSLWLWPRGSFYQALAGVQLLFLLLAASGAAVAWCGRRPPKLLAFPMYFCLVNLAALVAVTRTLSGRTIVVWQTPQRLGEERVAAR